MSRNLTLAWLGVNARSAAYRIGPLDAAEGRSAAFAHRTQKFLAVLTLIEAKKFSRQRRKQDFVTA